jgi:hypothetical protein
MQLVPLRHGHFVRHVAGQRAHGVPRGVVRGVVPAAAKHQGED